jgi:hypothetical protein
LEGVGTAAGAFTSLPTTPACNSTYGNYCGAQYFTNYTALGEFFAKNQIDATNPSSLAPYITDIQSIICNPCFETMNMHADKFSSIFNLFGYGAAFNVTAIDAMAYSGLCGEGYQVPTSTKSSAQPTSTPPPNPGDCTLEPFTQALAMCNPNIMSDLGTIQMSMYTNPSAASGSLNNVFNSICSESCISSAGNALSVLATKVRQGWSVDVKFYTKKTLF